MADEELIQPAPSLLKANVWAHFGFDYLLLKKELAMTYAVCKICKMKVKYFGNTSNPQAHMLRYHPELKEGSSGICRLLTSQLRTSKGDKHAAVIGY
ncbi:zinc finger BED domain-containing protein 1-like [Thalassophryne amazonica]|uniref:zinc finger BED domain-containing protein 1-like n=1 Tax=Thalassophryne amazonica TaxID=390379 RepID=UPI00147224B6|nr:zinc finger BED domain-containing protein 1-like [Thalassophryne amazonica]